MIAYIARQGIYDREKNISAYELLFRDGVENCFPDISPDIATSTMLSDSHLSVGVEKITQNKRAFINFHQDTLMYRFPTTLDPLSTVVEIVETVEINPGLVGACEHIKDMGYSLALDDYNFDPQWDVLVPLVKYIKIEESLIDESPETIQKIETFKRLGKILIAEKVETNDQYERLKGLGFDLFQGYFLSKPELLKHKSISVSSGSVAQLVSISASPEFNTDHIRDVFEKDVGLSFKLMRFINNPTMNKRQQIQSLDHALRYLGEVELKKFIALLAIANLKGDKPIEILVLSLVRAQFCKSIADLQGMKEDPPIGFLLGLFSYVDALLDQPMTSIVESLPFGDDVKLALIDPTNGSDLANQLLLCIAFERGEWEVISQICRSSSLEQSTLFEHYHHAVNWSDNMRQTLES